MANILDDLLGSELSLLFVISAVVWIIIFFYIYYTNNRLNNLRKELNSLKEE
jgi:CcmD family protein